MPPPPREKTLHKALFKGLFKVFFHTIQHAELNGIYKTIIRIYRAKSPNSVSGAGPLKSTRYGQYAREIHRKGTGEYGLASQAVLPSGFSVNSSGVLTVTGRFKRPSS